MPISTLAIEHRDFGIKRHRAWLHATLGIDTKYDPLVGSYLELFKGDRGKALREVNAACGTFYDLKSLGFWLRGDNRAPPRARDFMRREVLRSRLGDDLGDRLCRLLDIDPERVKVSRRVGHELI